MKELHEPEKLRPWLCGIARNVISNAWRRNKREPSQRAEPIEIAHEFPSPEAATSERVIQREEEAILWRSLERIPENYREPLILFYRQGESIQRVAQQLELSEEAVKQRLSRGRKFLADEVTAFVEGTLKQSAPGRAFTLGVIASLPVFATSASAATISAGAVKGSATASSSAIVSSLSMFLGPVIGIFGGYLGVKASLNAARTPRERAFIVQKTKRTIVAIVIFAVALFGYIAMAEKWWKQNPVLFLAIGIAIPVAYTIWIFVTAARTNRELRVIRAEEKKLHPAAFADEQFTPSEYRSKITLLGLPLVHIRNRQRVIGEKPAPAIGWIALGERAYGIIFAAGGVAVGGIAMGGFSVGILAMGGASLGLLATGGLAIGGIAFGGVAVGLLAAGGIAVGWVWRPRRHGVGASFRFGRSSGCRTGEQCGGKKVFRKLSVDRHDQSRATQPTHADLLGAGGLRSADVEHDGETKPKQTTLTNREPHLRESRQRRPILPVAGLFESIANLAKNFRVERSSFCELDVLFRVLRLRCADERTMNCRLRKRESQRDFRPITRAEFFEFQSHRGETFVIRLRRIPRKSRVALAWDATRHWRRNVS